MKVEEIINNIYILPEESLKELVGISTYIELPKGTILSETNKLGNDTYLIAKGIARAFIYREGNDVTFWLGREGEPIFAMKSYIENKPSYENIELLEKTILYQFNNTLLKELYKKDIHIANWGRKLAEQALIKAEENLISRQFKTATERYHELINDNPDLLQRVQLGHIASYLGITQVTLSRIRAEIK